MQVVDYAAPSTVKAVVSLLEEHGPRAKLLSGGTDIIVQVRERRKECSILIDVKKVPELGTIQFEPTTGLRLGASVPCCEIAEFEGLDESYPALVDSARLIGGTQIQSRASVGGNLCNGSPAADTIPSLIALGAECHIIGRAGSRQVAVDEFCLAPGRTCLQPDELLVSIRFPPPPPRSSSAYLRFIPRNEMDIAVAGAAVSLQLDESAQKFIGGRIALGAVAPTPLRIRAAEDVLKGAAATMETVQKVAELAKEAARPIRDMRGTIAQRKHLASVLVQRAFAKALARLGGVRT